MKKPKRILATALAPICLLGCVAGCGGKGFENKISLKDNQALLTNPDMGWNFTYYANTIYDFNNTLQSGDYLDDYPCETVFFRIGWNWLEPEEGNFNWDFTDKIANEWIEQGKRVAFCWVCTFPGDQSTPLWVRDAGAEGVQYSWQAYSGLKWQQEGEYYFASEETTINLPFSGIPQDAQEWALNKGLRNDSNYNGGKEVEIGDCEKYRGTWVPKYDDPVFLAKWENFLKAASERYDDNEAVEFIEIGSFGDWGEGHNSYTRSSPISTPMKRKHIDLYLKYFKNVQLMVNDEVVKNTTLIDYTKENGIGVSDHTVQVPTAGYEEGFPGDADTASSYYRTHPVLLENHNATKIMETYYNSVNNCHATYARINCNPYTAKRSEWTDKITRRLGYRLTFTEVSFEKLVAGEEIDIEYKIKNTGAAPCYKGGNPTFYLIDSLGRVKAKAVSDFDVKELTVGRTAEAAQEQTGRAVLQMPKSLLAGEYYIAVSVTKDGEDYYNLPLDHQDGTRKRYRIATFEVV